LADDPTRRAATPGELDLARREFEAARAARDAHGLTGAPPELEARYAAAAERYERALGATTLPTPATPAIKETVKQAAVTMGTTAGTTAGSKTGASIGTSVAGPLGTAVGAKAGAAVGAKAGALAGRVGGTVVGGTIGRAIGSVRSVTGALRSIPGGWRIAGAVERQVPSTETLMSRGGGSLLAGIEWFARKNPLYRLFGRFLPNIPWVRATAGMSCGCASSGSCGCNCCACGCTASPFLLVFALAALLIINVTGLFPGGTLPAVCERGGITCNADNGSVVYRIDPSDIPSGAVTYWRDAEARTGIPWFYLAAWEKVASDFGRANLADAPRNKNVPDDLVPQEVVDLLTAQASSGASLTDISDAPTTSADVAAALNAEAINEVNDLLRRLRAVDRGGSFGPYLITRDEWTDYGNPGAPPPGGDGTGSGDVMPGINVPLAAAYACANGVPITPPDPRKNPEQRALMSTAFLARLGAPDTPEMRRAVEAWAQQETSWRSRPIYSGNPFSIGAAATDQECGSFTTTISIAVFRDLRTAVEEAAEVLLAPANQIYGYGAVVAAARANDPVGFLVWLAASGWSGNSHYNCGPDGNGSNTVLQRYAELGGEVDPLRDDCIESGSGYDPALSLLQLNPYARRDGAYIVGSHLTDIYLDLRASGVSSLSNAAATAIDRPVLAQSLAMDAYFNALTDTTASPDADRWESSGVPKLFGDMVGYSDDKGGLFGTGILGSDVVRPKIDVGDNSCTYGGGSSSDDCLTRYRWPDEETVPAVLRNTQVTALQRSYACILVAMRASAALLANDPVAVPDFMARCDAYKMRAADVEIGSAESVAALLADAYIPAAGDPPPGQAILDREKLSTVMTALLAGPGAWDDAQSIVSIPTPSGEEQINLYASAIDAYAFELYEAYSAAEIRRSDADTPEARARNAELRFYGPLADDAVATTGITVDRTVVLATLVADEVMGNGRSTAGCRPFYGAASRTDGKAPVGDSSVVDRYDAIIASTPDTIPAVLRDASVRDAALTAKVDPLLLVAIAGEESNFNPSFSAGTRAGLFGLTATDATLYGVTDRANAADATAGAARKVGALLEGYSLKAAIGVYHAGAAAMAEAGGDPARLPKADRDVVTAVVNRYNKLIAASPIALSMADAPVSGLVGCYRWGSGEATLYDPAKSSSPERFAIAMNLCAPNGPDCGSAVVRVGNRAVVVAVVDFYDGGIGERDDQLAALRPAVRDALGLGGEGPFTVSIDLLGRRLPSEELGPIGDRDPAALGIDIARAGDRVLESGTPPEAVRAIVAEIRASLQGQGLSASDVPNLDQYGRFLAARGRCSTDESSLVEVNDPFRPATEAGLPAVAKVADCPYVQAAIDALADFTASGAGAINSSQYGLQTVSQFGFINPVVGGRITSGFLPRDFAARLRITANNRTYNVHGGVDFVITNFSDNLVVAISDGLAYWLPGTETYCVNSCAELKSRDTMLLFVKGSDGVTWLYGHVIPEFFPDASIAAAYDVSTLTVGGRRAVAVKQGDTLAQIAAGPNHLHLEAQFPARTLNTPYRYPFLNDPNATYSLPGGSFRVDPLTLLPQVIAEYASEKPSSLGEYYVARPYPGAPNFPFPPPADPARLPGFDGRVVTSGTGAIAPGQIKIGSRLLGPTGGTISWTKLAGLAGYDLRLIPATERDCDVAGGVRKSASANATSLTLDAADFAGFPSRAYAVCIRGRFADTRTTAWSRAVSAPTVTAPAANATTDRTPTVSWSAVGGATAYLVELSRTADFATPLSATVTGKSYTPGTPLATGQWYVRVSALAGPSGARVEGDPSPAIRFLPQ
jgi:hypothetical protein